MSELRAILLATGASDAKMEEGSLRVDANVSIRRPGDPFGTRCEIKNLNSLRSLGRAIEYEARRQIELVEAGETVRQETRHWNEDEGRTGTLRTKEEAEDYRYFPEPDLVPLDPGDEWIARVDAELPVLPAARRTALADAAGVAPNVAAVAIAVERRLDGLALEPPSPPAASPPACSPTSSTTWRSKGPRHSTPPGWRRWCPWRPRGELTASQAKEVLAEMVASGDDPAAIAKAKGYEPMGADDLAAAVDRVIAANAAEWTRFVEGDDKLRGKLMSLFVGQVMKATRGQADGKAVTALLRQRAGA